MSDLDPMSDYIIRAADHWPVRRADAARLAAAWTAGVQEIGALAPGGPAAQEKLQKLAALQQNIQVEFHPDAPWELRMRSLLYNEAVRLLGPEQTWANPPSWSDGTGAGGASLGERLMAAKRAR
jgi:hypothetical protein